MERRHRIWDLGRHSSELFLICSICDRPLEDAVRTPCDHLFCRACIIEQFRAGSTRCPACQRFVSMESFSEISSSMQSILDQVPVKCNLCGQRGIERRDFPKHIDYYCPYVLVSCPPVAVQCPWIGERYKLDCHLLACPFHTHRSTPEQIFAESRHLLEERQELLCQIEQMQGDNKLQQKQIIRLSEQLDDQKSEIDVLRKQLQGIMKQLDDNEKKKYLSDEPIPPEEEAYYQKCKRYFNITNTPLISISDAIFNENAALNTPILKFAIDENYDDFKLNEFLEKMCNILHINRNDIELRKIEQGCTVLEMGFFEKKINSVKEKIKIIYKSITDKAKKELAKLKVFFMFMGDVTGINEKQNFRKVVTLHPKWNRIYARDKIYWEGPLSDGKDRGDQPYFCPVGWKRYALFVTDMFDDKFKGWCKCYHGTKFQYGLSILLSGLKPANIAAHGGGIYATPSIIYACHPRYAEVKKLETADEKEFYKSGGYVQFVLECRVHPSNIKKIDRETLGVGDTPIDPNIKNEVIEWVVNHHGKEIVDFNDSDCSMYCTGLMVRVTDNHPGLLPDSDWWFDSHLCGNNKCCCLGIDLQTLEKQRENSSPCTIIFD